MNLVAAPMFPLIFIFPCKKAICGFRVPWANLRQSSSLRVKVASGLTVYLISKLDIFPYLSVGDGAVSVLKIDGPNSWLVTLLLEDLELVDGTESLDEVGSVLLEVRNHQLEEFLGFGWHLELFLYICRSLVPKSRHNSQKINETSLRFPQVLVCYET